MINKEYFVNLYSEEDKIEEDEGSVEKIGEYLITLSPDQITELQRTDGPVESIVTNNMLSLSDPSFEEHLELSELIAIEVDLGTLSRITRVITDWGGVQSMIYEATFYKKKEEASES